MLTIRTVSAYADTVRAVTDLEQSMRDVDVETGLRAVARLRKLTEQLEAAQVEAARRAGWSWQEIAGHLGVTKQSVHRKHHRAMRGRGW